MALSASKKASLKAKADRARREANIIEVSICKRLHAPFIESNWDQQAYDYLATGELVPGSFLAGRFAEAGISA